MTRTIDVAAIDVAAQMIYTKRINQLRISGDDYSYRLPSWRNLHPAIRDYWRSEAGDAILKDA